MIKKIPIISNADLSARNGVQKRGLQARAINALHCNAFLAIIIIVIIIIVVVVVVHISHHQLYQWSRIPRSSSYLL